MGSGCGIGGVGGVGIACGAGGVGIACGEGGVGIACGAGGIGIACGAGGVGIACGAGDWHGDCLRLFGGGRSLDFDGYGCWARLGLRPWAFG